VNSKFTSTLEIARPQDKNAMPTYRIMDQDGVVVDKTRAPKDISDEEMIKLYKDMLTGIPFRAKCYPFFAYMPSQHHGHNHV
jgi:hypothetical protein